MPHESQQPPEPCSAPPQHPAPGQPDLTSYDRDVRSAKVSLDTPTDSEPFTLIGKWVFRIVCIAVVLVIVAAVVAWKSAS